MYPSNRPWGKEQMDDLDYQYQQNPQGYLANNRLTQVTDAVEAVRYTMDIDQQGANNYGYDAIGNLVRDDAEKILNISWTVYGKIASIQKDNGLISYRYDAAGNRVYKESTMGGGLQKTWYVRDAQGNTLAVYNESGSSGVTWAEQQLYGSSRLGYWQIGLPKSSSIVSAWNDEGGRLYELSNHLGNVMAVVTDKAPDGQKNAELVRLQDDYAFGMEIPGRRSIFEGSSYRYGFNGKEKDNEIKGEGNQVAFEARIHDPRVGRFLSVDPLTKDYPHQSPYVFGGNNPIRFIDALGMASDDPPGWKIALYKTYTFFQEGRLFAWTDIGQQRKDDAKNVVNPIILGTGNGVVRQLSLGTINRSAEAIGLDERYHEGYNRSSSSAAAVPLLTGVGGGGVSPSLAPASGVQLTVTKSLDVTFKATVTLLASATGNVQAATNGINKNREDGSAREGAEFEDLQAESPDATVYRERLLRDKDGKKVLDPLTGQGRRVDFVVVKNGMVTKMVETTSMNATKVAQQQKEMRIRGVGGTYVKAPGRNGVLFNVKDIITQVSRRE